MNLEMYFLFHFYYVMCCTVPFSPVYKYGLKLHVVTTRYKVIRPLWVPYFLSGRSLHNLNIASHDILRHNAGKIAKKKSQF